jgi:phage/plasmid-like protein (TIGR03299 family)
MVYDGKEPWYGLGVNIDDTMTPEEMLEKANLNWEVQKIPLGQMIPQDFESFSRGESTEFVTTKIINKQWSLTRTFDAKHFDVVGETYKPTQNKEAFSKFMEFITAAGMKPRALGAVKDEKHIWLLAKINFDFELPGEDVVEGHVLLSSPHILGQGITIKHADIRNVGMNTVVQSLRDNAGRRFSLHVGPSRGLKEKSEAAMIAAKSLTEDFQEKSTFLCSRRAIRDDFKEFVYQLCDKGSSGNNVKIEDASRPAKKIYETFDTQPGRSLKSSNGTWWGALNAVLYTVDHVYSKDRDIALTNAWFGNRAQLKLNAIDLAVKYANNSKQI